MHKILVINPGSTSTKVAVYEDDKPLISCAIKHPAKLLHAYKHVIEQYEFRLEHILH